MSALQDAIKRWDSLDMDEGMEPEATLIRAARAQEALHKAIDLTRLNDGVKFGHITDSDGDYLVYVAQQVQAALGITEDTHKHDWVESILGDGQVCQVGDCGAFQSSITEDE